MTTTWLRSHEQDAADTRLQVHAPATTARARHAGVVHRVSTSNAATVHPVDMHITTPERMSLSGKVQN